MKNTVHIALSCLMFISLAVQAGVLPKNVQSVKDELDKGGATACSFAAAETLSFLADGRPFSNHRSWSTEDTNNRAITIDFTVHGDKSNYSKSGTMQFVRVGNKCRGVYASSSVFPDTNCKDMIVKEGFVAPTWKEELVESNGDGAEVHFIKLVESPSLYFILNDAGSGCALLKREQLVKDAVNVAN